MSQTFAEKLDVLFQMHRRRDGHEYSTRQVASWIQDTRGHAVSPAYIWQLRAGERDNPTKRHIEDLAAFFGVSPQYFFEDEDDEDAEQTQAELALLSALEQYPQVRHLALRSLGISAESLNAISETIERVRTLEGVDRPHTHLDGSAPGAEGERGAEEQPRSN